MFGFSWGNDGFKKLSSAQEIVNGCDHNAAKKILNAADNDRANTSSRNLHGHCEQFYFRKGKKGTWKLLSRNEVYDFIWEYEYDKTYNL